MRSGVVKDLLRDTDMIWSCGWSEWHGIDCLKQQRPKKDQHAEIWIERKAGKGYHDVLMLFGGCPGRMLSSIMDCEFTRMRIPSS